jgi:hypothetical protein
VRLYTGGRRGLARGDAIAIRGHGVTFVGDTDGDGTQEALIATLKGPVLLRGGCQPFDRRCLVPIPSFPARFADHVVPLGDVTGDGLADLVMADPCFVGSSSAGNTGLIGVLPSPVSSVSVWVTLEGRTSQRLGASIPYVGAP